MAVLIYNNTIRDGGAAALVAPGSGANGDTDTLDRGTLRRAALLLITSAIGATPTVTVNILGSADGVNFWNVAYSLVATPETPVVAALTITTAVTTPYILRQEHPWRFLKLTLSANTNVTLTVTLAA